MRITSALACIFLTACATSAPDTPSSAASLPTSAAGGASAPSRSYAEELVSYLGRLRTMSEASLATEASRMKREPGDLARVKAGLALALSQQSDEAEIIELVEPAMRRGDRDVRAMASFVHSLAMERRRLKREVASANGQLREERRNVESQKQRAEALQQKLEGLTELEKSLAERQATPR